MRYDEIHEDYKREKEKNQDITNIYNRIKKEYEEDFNKGKLNIELERLHLRNKLQEFQGKKEGFYSKVSYAIIGAILACISGLSSNISNEKINSVLDYLNYIIHILIGVLPIICIFYIFILSLERNKKKDTEKNKEKNIFKKESHFYYIICLEVLDEIEREHKELKKEPALNK